MNYSPHTLFVQTRTETRDEYNRISVVSGEWELVGVCRCDDNTNAIVSTVNSLVYVPKYHIVTNRTYKIHNGDMVRVLDSNGLLRGEGKADRVRVLNYLDYTDFYAG